MDQECQKYCKDCMYWNGIVCIKYHMWLEKIGETEYSFSCINWKDKDKE